MEINGREARWLSDQPALAVTKFDILKVQTAFVRVWQAVTDPQEVTVEAFYQQTGKWIDVDDTILARNFYAEALRVAGYSIDTLVTRV